MKILFSTLKKVLFWSYDRGTWQYDVMCVLILAFIFFGPNSLFHSRDYRDVRPLVVSAADLGLIDLARESEEVAARLSERLKRQVNVSRVDKVTDSASGETKYLVWENQ